MNRVDVVWGQQGLANAEPADTTIIVDVLSFSTAVDAGCTQGAKLYPFRWKDNRASAFAASVNAMLATQRQDAANGIPSLSPPSLQTLSTGDRLVLPSPNGSTLATLATSSRIICACLRNANAVAEYLNHAGGSVLVVAAGERWPDDSLRPALEDFLGAGSVVTHLKGTKSVDAMAAQAAFLSVDSWVDCLMATASGKELMERGFTEDVSFAAQLNSQIVCLCWSTTTSKTSRPQVVEPFDSATSGSS